jgi:hypothetical protein
MPKKLISWILPWTLVQGSPPQAIMIDPRGNAHIKFFRCCAVICLVTLCNVVHQRTARLQPRPRTLVRDVTMRKLMNVAELLATITL